MYIYSIIVAIFLIPPLSTLLSPPNFMHCLLEKAKNQTTESIYYYPYVHGCGVMQWDMGGLSGSASLGKNHLYLSRQPSVANSSPARGETSLVPPLFILQVWLLDLEQALDSQP